MSGKTVLFNGYAHYRLTGVKQESGTLERIWWCPTGPLSSLPLHAAGAYDGAYSTTRDFAISSYIPNVATLVKLMKSGRSRELTNDTTGVLIISQSATPGQPRLPGVRKEIAVVREILHEKGVLELHLEGMNATVNAVISIMSSCSSVHLACHASQHPTEPLESGFALHDGKLTLSEVMKANLRTAELAFLSACQTSTGDEKLSEEAMHLAAGMLAAGYQGVVATMWSIKDRYAPDIARDFYAELARLNLAYSRGCCGAGKAAEALHYAVGRLRSRLGDGEDALLTWVPYVHFGI